MSDNDDYEMSSVPDVDILLTRTNDILDFYMKFIPKDQLQGLTLRNEDEKLDFLVSHFHSHHIYQQFKKTFLNSQCLIKYENLCQEIQTLTNNLKNLLTIEYLPTVVEELGEKKVNKLKLKIKNILVRFYPKSLQVGILGMDAKENKIVHNLIKGTFTTINATTSLTARRPAAATFSSCYKAPYKYSSEHSSQNSKDPIVFYNVTESIDDEEMRANQIKINVKFALSQSIVLILVIDATKKLKMNRDLLDWIRKFGLSLDQKIILVLTKMHLIPVKDTKRKIKEIENYVRDELNLEIELDVVAMNTQNLIILKRLFSHSSPYHLQLLKYLILENILNIIKQRVRKDYEIIHEILMPLINPLVKKRLSFCRNEKLKHHIKEIWIRSFLKNHPGYKETIKEQIKKSIENESLALLKFLLQTQHFDQLTNCTTLPTIITKKTQTKLLYKPFFKEFLSNFQPLFLPWCQEFRTRINQNYHDFIKANLPFLEEKLRIEQPLDEMEKELGVIFMNIKTQFSTYCSSSSVPKFIGNNLERNDAFKKFVTSQVLNQNFIGEILLQPFGERYQAKIENLTEIVAEEIHLLKKRSEEFEKSDICSKVPRELVALENYCKSFDKLRFYWIKEEFNVEKEIFDRYRPRPRHVIVAESTLSKFYLIPNNNNDQQNDEDAGIGVYIVRKSLSSSITDWQTAAADQRGLFYAWDCLQKLNGNGKLSNLLPIPKYLLQTTSMETVSLYEVLFYPYPNDGINVVVYSLANYICNTVIPLFSQKQILKFILNCVKQIVEILISIHQSNLNVVCYDMRPEAIFIIKTGENISLRLCEFANEKNPKYVDKKYVNYFPPEHLRDLSCFAESDVYNIGILIWQLYYFHSNKDKLYSLEDESIILLNQPFDTGNYVHYSCASRLHGSHEIQPEKLKLLLFDCMRLQMDERPKLEEILNLLNEIQEDVENFER